MASPTSTNPDFTSFRSAFLPLELSCYPDCVKSTVERMRHLSTTIPEVDCTKVLGKGNSGTVFMGSYLGKSKEKVVCAVKVFFSLGDCKREVKMYWKCAGISSMAAFHGFFPFNQKHTNAIALDYVEGSSLFKKESKESIPSVIHEDVTELAWQLVKFLAELQTPAPNRKNILIHGDLFLDNIFWNDRKLVVIDLGLMSEKGDSLDPIVQKPIARAPEIFLNQLSKKNDNSDEVIRYDESIDMWSLGIMIHAKLTNSWLVFPFPSSEKIPHGHFEVSTLAHRVGLPTASYLKTVVAAEQFFEISEDQTVTFKQDLAKFQKRTALVDTHKASASSTPEILAFLQKIFVWNPAERMTVAQALKDPIFKGKQ